MHFWQKYLPGELQFTLASLGEQSVHQQQPRTLCQDVSAEGWNRQPIEVGGLKMMVLITCFTGTASNVEVVPEIMTDSYLTKFGR